MNDIIYYWGFFATTLLVIALSFLLATNEKLTETRHELDYYRTTYLHKSGATCLWSGSKGVMINYNLRSFDGGLSWYAVQRHGELGDYVNVLGEVETIYPGLMAHLTQIDNIVKYVDRHGPLNLNDPVVIDHLKEVGFTVSTNK